MVAVFVVLTIVFFVAVDYFIQRKQKVGLAADPKLQRINLSQLLKMLPPGIFLHPTFTWSKLLDSGNLIVGINPVILGLIGEPDEIQLLKTGEKVQKGEVLLSLRKGDKVLHLKSPVSGIVTGINEQVLQDSTWENLSQSWLYSLKPEKVAQEIPNWYVAEKSQQWLQEKYQQIKSFLMGSLPGAHAGLTMADGGDLTVGILANFDKTVWKQFEQEVLES